MIHKLVHFHTSGCSSRGNKNSPELYKCIDACRVKAGKVAPPRGLGVFLWTSWNRSGFLRVFSQNSAPWVELDTWKLRFIFGFRQEELETRDWHLCSH